MAMSDHLTFLVTTAVLSISAIYGFWRLKTAVNHFRKMKRERENCRELAKSTLLEIKKFQKVSLEDCQRINYLDENTLLKKLTSMYEDGLDLFQIITDFDRTLSKAKSMGKPIPSTHGILELYPEFNEDTKQKFSNLRNTYLPIEFNPHLSDEEKVPYMEEWWSQTHGELIRSGVKQHLLTETVASAGVVLRDGVPDFLAMSHKLSVPVLIFSAGIGNVIEELLQRFNCCFNNIQVASNYMTFDPQGDLTGFQSDVIHTYNKAVSSCVQSDFCINNLKRRNVLLLGDSTGDRRMADGAVAPEDNANVLRIGFLNGQVKDSLDVFMKHFDLVLIDDPTFDIPNVLLSQMGNHCR